MFDVMGFKTGALAFFLAFVVAGLFTLAFIGIYQLVTPYKEGELLRKGNSAASIALGGAIVGYVLPLCSALAHTESLLEFAAWAVLAGVIQIVAFTLVRHLALPNVKERIEANEVSAGIYLLSISVAVGLLNAACMTS
jgi:putative membrane protein